MAGQLHGDSTFEHTSIQRQEPKCFVFNQVRERLSSRNPFAGGNESCSLFGEQGRSHFRQCQARGLEGVPSQILIEPSAVRLTDHQFDKDAGIEVHGSPTARVAVLSNQVLRQRSAMNGLPEQNITHAREHLPAMLGTDRDQDRLGQTVACDGHFLSSRNQFKQG